MTFRFLEGYLLKTIEGRQFYHKDQYHIRFFRIIFHTGKLVIKQDRKEKNMRSISL